MSTWPPPSLPPLPPVPVLLLVTIVGVELSPMSEQSNSTSGHLATTMIVGKSALRI